MDCKQAIKNLVDVPKKFNISGGDVTGNINMPNDTSIKWSRNTDGASISFKSTSDSDTDSYMKFETSDNGNEYFKFCHKTTTSTTDWFTIKGDGARVKGNLVYHTGNKPSPADIGAATSSHNHDSVYLGKTAKAESAKVADSVAWGNVSGKPSSYPPSSHTHNYAGSSSAGGAATSALACTGNSATATTLATARTINGTSFNGSANITTANWGTSRTITIGSKGKSINGSANVSWTLAEIGAAASSHSHNYAGSSSAGGNANASVKLATARSINGTNFDGTGNITTANWGTTRTLTVGKTGKSVNGSGNISWSLSEIGAFPASKLTISKTAPSSPATGDLWISY